MAAIFIAQATNTAVTVTQQITLLVVLMLTLKGVAGVTGSGFIVLVAGLADNLGVDCFMSEVRAITNVIGNGAAAVIVAKWTGDLDTEIFEKQLAAGPSPLK